MENFNLKSQEITNNSNNNFRSHHAIEMESTRFIYTDNSNAEFSKLSLYYIPFFRLFFRLI